MNQGEGSIFSQNTKRTGYSVRFYTICNQLYQSAEVLVLVFAKPLIVFAVVSLLCHLAVFVYVETVCIIVVHHNVDSNLAAVVCDFFVILDDVEEWHTNVNCAKACAETMDVLALESFTHTVDIFFESLDAGRNSDIPFCKCLS